MNMPLPIEHSLLIDQTHFVSLGDSQTLYMRAALLIHLSFHLYNVYWDPKLMKFNEIIDNYNSAHSH